MYEDKKIKRYKIDPKNPDPTRSFNTADSYNKDIAKYIYTDIKITDHTESLDAALQSRLQRLMSSALLRSIQLKNGCVDALNDENFPSFYASLKSFYETAALLGYITYNLYHSKKNKIEIIEIINNATMGVRTKKKHEGVIPHSPIQQTNINTMFEKLDKVIEKISEPLPDSEKQNLKNLSSSDHSDLCNFAHINFPAHILIGHLGKDQVWRAKDNNDNYKREMLEYYLPHFTSAINLIVLQCDMIIKHDMVCEFESLNNPFYFDFMNK